MKIPFYHLSVNYVFVTQCQYLWVKSCVCDDEKAAINKKNA